MKSVDVRKSVSRFNHWICPCVGREREIPSVEVVLGLSMVSQMVKKNHTPGHKLVRVVVAQSILNSGVGMCAWYEKFTLQLYLCRVKRLRLHRVSCWRVARGPPSFRVIWHVRDE